MKILLFSDVHFSKTTSILKSIGTNYTVRLEKLVQSMNWVNKLALSQGCGLMICAGDFVDKSVVSDEEITAISTIEWNQLPCYFVVGNHDSSVDDLRYNVVEILNTRAQIIKSLSVLPIPNYDIVFLPYIRDSVNLTIQQCLDNVKDKLTGNPIIIVSHNDLSGVVYNAGIESRVGFNIFNLPPEVKLFLNGHLHNSWWATKNVLNLGSLSAHNFTNDSLRYKYGAWILNTDTLEMQFFENPFGLNFYQFEIGNKNDISQLDNIKPNSILRIRCSEKLYTDALAKVGSQAEKILAHHIIQRLDESLDNKILDSELQSSTTTKIDYLGKLVDFCREEIENSDILLEELAIICG